MNTVKYNRNIVIPQDNYVVRCIEESFSPSKRTNNPMIALEFEIQHPTEVEVGDEMVTMAGEKISTYHVVQVIEDGVVNADKTAKCATQLEDLYKKFGLSFEGFNPENPVLGFKGKLVHVRIRTSSKETFKALTQSEKAAGKTVGEKLMNPVTGKPVLMNQLAIAEIYGLAEEKGAI